MKTTLALSAVLALLLIANTLHARPSTGEYWHVMKGEEMPIIQDVVGMRNSADSALSNRKCDTKVSVDESDPVPDVTVYHGDSLLKGTHSYVEESDPVPDVTIYHGNSHLNRKNSYLDESDPIPDVTTYHGDSHLKGKNSYVDESDPIPDVTIYHGDSHIKGKM